MNVARITGAGVLAIAITMSLLYLMLTLIESSQTRPDDGKQIKVADITMPEREIKTEYEAVKPDKPEDPQAPPPDMPEPDFDTPDVATSKLSMTAPRVKPNLDIKGVGFGGGDGEYLPIVKVQPQYPRRALSSGIEGYVIVEFTVTTNGSVRDPFVVESMAGRRGNLSPSSIFDSAATKAAQKFKYKPRVVDGEPVEVPGVRNKITFAIAE